MSEQTSKIGSSDVITHLPTLPEDLIKVKKEFTKNGWKENQVMETEHRALIARLGRHEHQICFEKEVGPNFKLITRLSVTKESAFLQIESDPFDNTFFYKETLPIKGILSAYGRVKKFLSNGEENEGEESISSVDNSAVTQRIRMTSKQIKALNGEQE